MKDELIVFVRIGLYAIAGAAARGGWLPPELQSEIISPAAVEAVTGTIIGAGTFMWYLASRARAALREAMK